MGAVIETDRLTKTYGKDRGIKNVDLTVNEGEVFGFLGPNGAGKTTTVRTLLGFMKPTDGRAEVFGLDIEKDSVAIRALIGNLPGEFTLEDRMTGDQLLKFFARLRGVKDLDYAYEIAERIDADMGRPMRRLSRGNKQKIGLVQAMFHKPPLLILDEPTGGLDPLVQEEFLKIIGEVKDEGRTVFFSSHTLNEVERICDRVGIIREGRLSAVENTDDLINKSFRHVSLTFAEELESEEANRFQNLEGVEGFDRDGVELTFDLHGNLDDMIKLAARHELVDMMYERPSLEEIFLAYYSDEGSNVRKPSSRSTESVSKNSKQRTTETHAQSHSYHPERKVLHNGNGTKTVRTDAGVALQKAIEEVVDQAVERSVEKTFQRMIAGRTVAKGERL
jgi:ABC-2 type transport system ATP-binding protein